MRLLAFLDGILTHKPGQSLNATPRPWFRTIVDLLILLLGLCVYAALGGSLQAQTNISIGTSSVTGVKRIGINLGDHNYFDKPLLKNLIMTNPGFNPTIWQAFAACQSGSTSTCNDANGYSGWSTSWWPYGTAVQVYKGSTGARFCTTAISSYTQPSGGGSGTYTFQSACPQAIQAGDWIQLKMVVNSSNPQNDATVLAQGIWWPYASGGASITTEQSDVPAATDSQQAADLNAPSSSGYAVLTNYFDAQNGGKSFITINGTFEVQFWAKSKAGSGMVGVNVKRASASSSYYNANTTLTGNWTLYRLPFTVHEDGYQTGHVEVDFSTVSGADEFLIDNIRLIQTDSSSSNPTVFRDQVVQALVDLKPGVIRMWDQGPALTNTLDNMLADEWGRMPVDYTWYPAGGYSYNLASYSLPEFLQLAQTVGSGTGSMPEVSVVFPVSFSASEASNLIDYLSGVVTTPATCTGGPAYAVTRCKEGFPTPWTQVFPMIHLECGNEAWNATFSGGAFPKITGVSTGPTVYAARAQEVFAAMKANLNYDSVHTSLVLDAQFAAAGDLQAVQNLVTNNDEIEVAPYMMNAPTLWDSDFDIWAPVMAEPWIYYNASNPSAPYCAEFTGSYPNACPSQAYLPTGGSKLGGGMYLDLTAESLSSHPVKVSIYEENMGTGQGSPASFTQAQVNAYASAWGGALALADLAALGIQAGVVTQNVFTLAQNSFGTTVSGVNAPLWGILIDMGGPTNRKRPQFVAQQLLNNAIVPGGSLLATTQSNTPTFNVGSPNTTPTSATVVNSVAGNNIPAIQSFAFNGGPVYSLVIFNMDPSTPHTVTLSGANAPATGTTVTQSLLSQNLTDNNETSATVQAPTPSTFTYQGAAITLPAHSMLTLTWGGSSGGGTTTPAPAVSLSSTSLSFASTVGVAAATQTVTVTNSGNATLSSIAITRSGSSAFSQTNTCSSSLAAAASCTITVAFTPATSAGVTGTISISDNALNSPQTISLSGTGSTTSDVIVNQANNYTSPLVVTFPSTNVGTPDPTQQVNFYNGSSGVITMSGVNLVQNGSTYAGGASTGSVSSPDFTVVYGDCQQGVGTGGSFLSFAVYSGCRLTVSFNPQFSGGGTRTATVQLLSNASDSPTTFTLTGAVNGGGGTAPIASLSQTSLTFSSAVNTPASAQTVTLTNAGTDVLQGIGITKSGSSTFTQTNNCPTSLAVSASCTITVNFTPTATGTLTGSISIADNASGSPQTISLSGTGTSTSAPVVALSPASLTFYSTVNVAASTQTITVQNSGSANLTSLAVALSGSSAFTQTNNCPSTLTVLSTCTITVGFTPTTTGQVTGTITLTDSAANSPQTATLTGNGTAVTVPSAGVSPSSLSFASTVGVAAATQTVILTSSGSAPLDSIAISITGSTTFTQTNNCPGSLAVLSTCTITVAFTPSSTGNVTGTLSISDNASGSPQTVTLSGSGTVPSPNHYIVTTGAGAPVALPNHKPLTTAH